MVLRLGLKGFTNISDRKSHPEAAPHHSRSYFTGINKVFQISNAPSFRAIALNEDVKRLEAPKSPYKKIDRKFIAIRHAPIKSGIDLIDTIISVQVIPSPKERAELEIIPRITQFHIKPRH